MYFLGTIPISPHQSIPLIRYLVLVVIIVLIIMIVPVIVIVIIYIRPWPALNKVPKKMSLKSE